MRRSLRQMNAGVSGCGALVCLAMLGCSSMGDVLKSKSKGGGTAVEYPLSRDQAYDICMAIFRWEGSDAIEEHKSQGYMLTSWTTGEGGGTVAGAFVEPGAGDNTKVTVITMRRKSLSM